MKKLGKKQLPYQRSSGKSFKLGDRHGHRELGKFHDYGKLLLSGAAKTASTIACAFTLSFPSVASAQESSLRESEGEICTVRARKGDFDKSFSLKKTGSRVTDFKLNFDLYGREEYAELFFPDSLVESLIAGEPDRDRILECLLSNIFKAELFLSDPDGSRSGGRSRDGRMRFRCVGPDEDYDGPSKLLFAELRPNVKKVRTGLGIVSRLGGISKGKKQQIEDYLNGDLTRAIKSGDGYKLHSALNKGWHLMGKSREEHISKVEDAKKRAKRLSRTLRLKARGIQNRDVKRRYVRMANDLDGAINSETPRLDKLLKRTRESSEQIRNMRKNIDDDAPLRELADTSKVAKLEISSSRPPLRSSEVMHESKIEEPTGPQIIDKIEIPEMAKCRGTHRLSIESDTRNKVEAFPFDLPLVFRVIGNSRGGKSGNAYQVRVVFRIAAKGFSASEIKNTAAKMGKLIDEQMDKICPHVDQTSVRDITRKIPRSLLHFKRSILENEAVPQKVKEMIDD